MKKRSIAVFALYCLFAIASLYAIVRTIAEVTTDNTPVHAWMPLSVQDVYGATLLCVSNKSGTPMLPCQRSR